MQHHSVFGGSSWCFSSAAGFASLLDSLIPDVSLSLCYAVMIKCSLFFCCWAVYKHVLQSEHADYIETTKEEIIEYSSSLSTVAVIWLDLIAAESAINGADVAKHLSVLLHFKIILSGLWQLAETIAVFSVDVYYYFDCLCVFSPQKSL